MFFFKKKRKVIGFLIKINTISSGSKGVSEN